MNKLKEASQYIDEAEGHPNLSLNDDRVRIGRQKVIMIMKQYAYGYHEAKLKEELMRWDRWCVGIANGDLVDEYLKQRTNNQ